MKRTWSAITAFLGICFVNSPIGHSQPIILIAPEIEQLPQLPPKPSPPEPLKFTERELRKIKKFPFPIPNEIRFDCPQVCRNDYCVLCTTATKQLEAGWCWNAVSQIVLNYHDIPDNQCTIADRVYPQQSPCCLNDGRPDPNNDCGLTQGGFPQNVFEEYGFNYSPDGPPPLLQLLYWGEAKRQILAERPYIAWISPNNLNLSDHILVVHGFTTSRGKGRELKIIDPQSDPIDDWWQWDAVHQLGNSNNTHVGDIADIEP